MGITGIFFFFYEYRSIPLQKLAFSRHGVELFDELCMRVDVNQVNYRNDAKAMGS